MKLSPRLKTIADLVNSEHCVADIGTDHAYIPVYLKEHGHIGTLIASDINKGPLDNAKETISENRMTEEIETRLGGGLEPYEAGEIDTAIIAGMGGILISQILEMSEEVARSLKTMILQPMQAQDELRKWLAENNYRILDEKLVKEGQKYYEILVIQTGKSDLKDEIYNEIGYLLPENGDPLFVEFLETKIRKYQMILKQVEKETSESSVQKKAECLEKLKHLEAIKNAC